MIRDGEAKGKAPVEKSARRVVHRLPEVILLYFGVNEKTVALMMGLAIQGIYIDIVKKRAAEHWDIYPRKRRYTSHDLGGET